MTSKTMYLGHSCQYEWSMDILTNKIEYSNRFSLALNDWQRTCSAEYSADNDKTSLSVFSLIISFLSAQLSSYVSVLTDFLTFCRQDCGENSNPIPVESKMHASSLSYFLPHVFRRLACHPSHSFCVRHNFCLHPASKQKSRQIFGFFFHVMGWKAINRKPK